METNQSEGPPAHSGCQGRALYPASLALHQAAEEDRRRDDRMRSSLKGMMRVVCVECAGGSQLTDVAAGTAALVDAFFSI